MPRPVDILLRRPLNRDTRPASGATALALALNLLAFAIAMLAIALPAERAGCAPARSQACSSDLSRQMKIAGAHSSAYVYDLTSKQVLFSVRASTKRPPASVEKLYTATAALEKFGPTAQLSTTVLGTGQLGPNGVWEGDLYLHGGGDPTFGDISFIHSHYGGVAREHLDAGLTARAHRRHPGGPGLGLRRRVLLRLAARRAVEQLQARIPFLEGTLSALAFDRGETGKERGAHAPAAYAAHKLWAMLKNDGVSVRGSSRHRECTRRLSSARLGQLADDRRTARS